MFPDQSKPFAAQVYFFSIEQIRDILKSLLAKYYSATGRDREETEDEDEKEEFTESFSEIRTVLDAFKALFCAKDEFESEGRAKDYLNKAQDDEEVLETLVGYAEELVSIHLDGLDFFSVAGSTTEDFL